VAVIALDGAKALDLYYPGVNKQQGWMQSDTSRIS
jgi:hypothetical protein